VKLIYLDQKGISNIAKGKVLQKDAEEVKRLVDEGLVAVVIAPTHAVETALCGDKALRECIIDYVDNLKSRLWLRISEWILQKEVEQWFRGR